MNITYHSIILRAIEESDMDFCREMINSAEIEATTVGMHYPISVSEQLEWFRRGRKENELRLLAEQIGVGPIGMVTLTGINWVNRSAEVGIKLAFNQTRRTENTRDLCACFLSYVFRELNIHCLYTYVLDDNLLSRKLLLRSGFHEDGVLRQRVYKRGRYHDLIAYSLLMDEYFSRQAEKNEETKENEETCITGND